MSLFGDIARYLTKSGIIGGGGRGQGGQDDGSGGGGQPWDERIPGMDTDPYGRPKLPGLGSNDPGMGNSTPVDRIRVPRDPGMSFPAATLPNAPLNDHTPPQPIEPADVGPQPPPTLMAQATGDGSTPPPRTGKLTDDMAATSKVDSVGQRPTTSPAPAAPLPPNTTSEGLDKDLMEMSKGMPPLRDIYDDSQAQIIKQRADIDKLEHPSMKSMFMKFIPSLALTGLGAAVGGKRGAMYGASAGMGYPMGVAKRKEEMYKAKNENVKTEEGRQDKAVESGIRAREVAARMSEAKDYHAATIGVRQQHEDTLKGKYSQQQELNERKAGLARDEEGVLRPLPAGQLTEQQRANLDNTQEGANLKRSIEDLDAAKAELARSQNDPNSAAYQLASRKLSAAMYGHQIAAANFGQKQLEWEYHMSGTQGGVPVPGQLTIDGQPIGDKPAQYNKLTSRQQDTVSQARSVEAVGKDLSNYIRAHKDLFGPMSGRGNMLSRIIGSTDPKYADFQQKFDSFVALHPKLHDFRGLTAAKMFEKTYGGGVQNADALASSIDTGIGSAATIRKANLGNRGTVPMPPRTNPAAPAAPAAPNAPAPGGKKSLAAPEGTRALQGDGSWMVKRGGKWVTEAVQ